MKSKILKWLSDLAFYCRSHEFIHRDSKAEFEKEVLDAQIKQAGLSYEEKKAKWEENRRKHPETICSKCHWYRKVSYEYGYGDTCKSPEAPVTDFVSGEKDPKQINIVGKCQYYKPRVGVIL